MELVFLKQKILAHSPAAVKRENPHKPNYWKHQKTDLYIRFNVLKQNLTAGLVLFYAQSLKMYAESSKHLVHQF